MKGEYSGDVKVESGCDISCKNETGEEPGNLQIHRGPVVKMNREEILEVYNLNEDHQHWIMIHHQ